VRADLIAASERRKRQANQGDKRHAHQQEQQMAEADLTLIGLGTLEQEAKSREKLMFGLLPHQ
jgi:hypothetical protein